MTKSIKVGELEIPADYWSLKEQDKKDLCLTIADAILTIIEREINPDVDRKLIMDRLLESSIQTNEEDENYEICQVLKDIKQIINE